MNSIANLSPAQLRQAADIQEQIFELRSRLEQILGASAGALVAAPVAPAAVAETVTPSSGKRRLSPEGLANIRAGVRKRQAARALALGSRAPVSNGGGGHSRPKMTPAGRKALAAKLKARWALAKASGKSRL